MTDEQKLADAWGDEPTATDDMAKLDELTKQYFESRAKDDEIAAKLKASKKVTDEIAREIENTLINLPEPRTKWEVEGLCRINLVTTRKYKTPSTIEDKKKAFKYINESEGADVFWDVVGINSQTLNRFVKDKLENDAEYDPSEIFGDAYEKTQVKLTKVKK